MEEKASEAAKKFEDEFDFRKMDTMIHRFPPELGENISSSRYSYMVVPRFVAIGPYHQGKEDLKKMEAVKKAAAHFLWQRSNKLEQAVKKAADAHYKHSEKTVQDRDATDVIDAVHHARDMYFLVTEEGMMKDDPQFGDMMIYDACFLLLYMDAYNRSHGEDGDKHVEPSMRRFLFCNRDRINSDIMLLENQLPWRVIQVIIDLASELKLKETVGRFIAAMGMSFKISESSDLESYEWYSEPPHLLALLQRHTTDATKPDKTHSPCASASSSSASVDVLSDDDDDVENNNNHPPPSSSPLEQSLIIHQVPTPPSSPLHQDPTQPRNRDEVVISEISPMDLEQIGIKLTTNPTAKFSDMGLEERWVWSHLKLAPLSLDDTGASWLVNMAAFEVCTASSFVDPPDRTAVCSYLALLAFFMVGKEDVRKLRSMGLLRGPNKDDEMLDFFETLKKHLPDYGAHFARVMADVQKYQQKRYIMTTLYKWVYNNWKTVGTVFSITVAVVTAIAAIIHLYQALLDLIHN